MSHPHTKYVKLCFCCENSREEKFVSLAMNIRLLLSIVKAN